MTKLWHDLRARNIGGSESAALFNCSPYITNYELWHIKRGNIEPESLEENQRMKAGQFLEKSIMAWANHEWKLALYQPEIYVEHAEVKGMGCTPDAYDKLNVDTMAQIKNVDSLQFAREWSCEGEFITKAPLHIIVQIQHELECCDKDTSFLIVLVGGNRLFYMKIDRDREFGDIIKNRVKRFWASDFEPEPDYRKDLKSIKALKQSGLVHGEYEDYSDDARLYRLLKQRAKLKKEIGERADKLQAIEAEVIHLSDDGGLIRCRDIMIKFIERKGTPDKTIKEEDVGTVIKGRKASLSMSVEFEG